MKVRAMILTANAIYNLQIAAELTKVASWLTNADRIYQLNSLADRLETGAFNHDTTTTDFQRRMYFKAAVCVLMRQAS